jgi:hypothetical protein
MAAYTPMARFRGSPSGKLVAISASAVGEAMAAPTPWAAREAMSHTSVWENPPTREARANRPMPTMNMRRRP